MKSSTVVKSGVLTSAVGMEFNNLTAPSLGPVNTITSFKYSGSLNNLNYDSFKQVMELAQKYNDQRAGGMMSGRKLQPSTEEYNQMKAELMNLFNTNSSLNTLFSIDTNQGKSSLMMDFCTE